MPDIFTILFGREVVQIQTGYQTGKSMSGFKHSPTTSARNCLTSMFYFGTTPSELIANIHCELHKINCRKLFNNKLLISAHALRSLQGSLQPRLHLITTQGWHNFPIHEPCSIFSFCVVWDNPQMFTMFYLAPDFLQCCAILVALYQTCAHFHFRYLWGYLINETILFKV